MVRIIIRIFIVLCTIVSARDLYVSKSALEQYETNDYLLFDFFSDTLEALHSTHPDYLPAVDAIDLGKDGPKVGEQFTLEARIYQDGSCLLYTSPSPRDQRGSRMPSSA